MCDIVVKKFTFAISTPDEFLFSLVNLSCFSENLNGNTDYDEDVTQYAAIGPIGDAEDTPVQ